MELDWSEVFFAAVGLVVAIVGAFMLSGLQLNLQQNLGIGLICGGLVAFGASLARIRR